MRRRIIIAIVGVTALAIALFGFPLAFVIRQLYINDATSRLQREATVAARDVPLSGALSEIKSRNDTPGVRIGIYTPAGRRASGEGPDPADREVMIAAGNRALSGERDDRFISAVPIVANGVVVAVVRADTSTHSAEHRAHLAWVLMTVLGTLVLGFAGGLALVEANRLTRPLRDVRDSAIRLGTGDFGITVPPAGVPELDDVADALTSTAKRLGQAMQREQSLATDASHQLRTPLAGLRLALETELTAPRTDPSLALRESLAATDRLEATVNDLLRLVRGPDRNEQLDVAQLWHRSRDQWTAPLAATGRELYVDTPLATPGVFASNAGVAQALDVLLDNALRHGGGAVTLTSAAVDGGVCLTVTDEGGDQPTMADGDHFGIGLDLATTLIEAERGRLVRPAPGQPSAYAIILSRTRNRTI